MQGLTKLDSSVIDAYDALSVPIWLFSPDTLRILASNRTARDWLGYDARTLHSKTIADLRPAHERAGIREQVQLFEDTNRQPGTWSMIASSGTCYTVSVGWTKVLFDGSRATVASTRDLTQAARASSTAQSLAADLEALEKKGVLQAEHFRRLFDAVPGKMLVLTPENHTIVAVTDEYAKAVNSSREALLGVPLFHAFPDDPNEPEADGTRNLKASLRKVQALHMTDVMNVQRYPVRTHEGEFQERFWLPLNKPVFDAAGKLLYIIHRVEDVTSALTDNAPRRTSRPPTRQRQPCRCHPSRKPEPPCWHCASAKHDCAPQNRCCKLEPGNSTRNAAYSVGLNVY